MKLSDQLQGIINELGAAGTETTLMLGAIILLVFGLFQSKPIFIKLLFAATIVFGIYMNLRPVESGFYISTALYLDEQLVYFISLLLLGGLLILLFPRDQHSVEFYFLVLSLLVGCSFMLKANSLLLVYLSIELVSFVSYILTGFNFRKQGFEAAIKYLLFGTLSSAVMLIGLALIYGTTNTFFLSDWTFTLFSSIGSQVGLLFLCFGLLFKIAIFPFHVWTPATYQAAPSDAVALLSVAPKLAGLLLLRRVLLACELTLDHWVTEVLLVLGVVTILVGTFGAIGQNNVRRMISFGSIAHSGFLLGLILAPSGHFDKEAFWWYSAIYVIMNIAAFFIVDQYERKGILLSSDYFQSQKSVWLGAVFTLVLVSLVGIPPLAGFTAKLFLFSSLWRSYQVDGQVLQAVFLFSAVFATVASLFFYLKVPKNIFLSPKAFSQNGFADFSLRSKFIATLFAIILLLAFFVPSSVMNLQMLLHNTHE
ncbi:MAG: proton-conducting transporter membrane subunit [Bacteroidota bacterium]